MIVAGILGIADARCRGAQDRHGARQYFVAAQLAQRQIAPQAAAQRRQRGDKVGHALELGAVAHLAPGLVVAVLLAPARITTSRLQVAARCAADPDIVIRGWHRPSADATLSAVVANHPAARCQVAESASDASSHDPGHRIAHVDQPGSLRRAHPLPRRIQRLGHHSCPNPR